MIPTAGSHLGHHPIRFIPLAHTLPPSSDLQHNRLSRIEGLAGLPLLRILDVSNNELERLEGLDVCPRLETLLTASNRLSGPASVQHLRYCTALAELDIGHNVIEDPAVLDVLASMGGLRTLTLQGNPLVLPKYRSVAYVGVGGREGVCLRTLTLQDSGLEGRARGGRGERGEKRHCPRPLPPLLLKYKSAARGKERWQRGEKGEGRVNATYPP